VDGRRDAMYEVGYRGYKVQSMRALLKTALMFLAFSAVAIADSEEVIVACSVQIAFYEVAPKRMANSMRKAVMSACAEAQLQVGLCSGEPLRFVRAVGPGGDRGVAGFACREETVGDFKYFSQEMIQGADCVSVSYSFEPKQHFVARSDLPALTAPTEN